MPDSTLQGAVTGEPAGALAPQRPGVAGARTARLRPALSAPVQAGVGAVILLGLATALVLWARTRPGFDPYGWLVWGHQTITGSLDTNAAPSWKPLPYLFTVPYALAGHYQLWLWMITSVAVSLSGVVFAARIAYRLVDPAGTRRWAALAAGAFAGVALLGIDDYSHYVLSAQSDPMIVSLCLGAIDCHLSGRARWALWLGVLGALGRPEVWPFLGLYGIWCWRRRPAMRWMLVAAVVLLALLWFGIPALTSRTPFVAADNAIGSGRAVHGNKVLGTISRFTGLYSAPLEILALLTVIWALVRRDRTILALAGGVVVWVVVEIAFVLHGWPGIARYMFEAAGVMIVIAGVGFGRLIADGRAVSRGAGVAGLIVALAFAGALVPTAVSRARVERTDLATQRKRTAEINRLTGTIRSLGGAARLRACGEPLTRLEYQTMLAWQIGENVSRIGFKYSQAVARGDPIMLFTPEPDGWKVEALHQTAAACRSLPR